MDIIIATLILIVAVAMMFNKPVRIEITHKHVANDTLIQETISDPNNPDDVAVEDTVASVIQTINAIMNGGELPDERK